MVIINCKKGEWGLRPQAGGFTPSTPEIILNLIVPSDLTSLDLSATGVWIEYEE